MVSYRGTPVAEGVTAGELYLPDAPAPASPSPGDPTTMITEADVRAAFTAVAAERAALAETLLAAGREHEAGIVEIGALIAADPALSGPALEALTPAKAPMSPAAPLSVADGADPAAPLPMAHGADMTAGVPLSVAVAAVLDAAGAQAAVLESLPDPDLAQRAGDVRQIGAAVVARLTGGAVPPPPDGPFILVRREVDPADLIRLADEAGAGDPAGERRTGTLVGAVSVAGGASSHAAIVARGLGLPMLTGVDLEVLAARGAGTDRRPGRLALLDATVGALIIDPDPADLDRAEAGRELARVSAETREPGPFSQTGFPGRVITADGELVTVLCNVASAAETRLGLANGAAGVGLLRTEIPFTHAAGWPAREEHLAQLAPILGCLRGRRAVVRLLDFAGDKIPPFPGAEGLPAFLAAPGALAAQLAAILEAGAGTDLAVMIPMVRSLDEVEHVRRELTAAAKAAGVDAPPLGMMVELAATAAAAAGFAPHVDFFSIGTNDLTADVLGRARVALGPSDASERTVVSAIAHVTRVAGEAGIGLSVCGDAAADPTVLPLLLGLGVRTVSVGAANVSKVGNWITRTDVSKVAIPDVG
jgi:phosphoenolpyruvate-protein kinase (PTS system EI component)